MGCKMAKREYGFDLTDFGSVENFKSLLKRHNLKRYKKVKANPGEYSYNTFTWSAPGLKLITGNNPITGEYSSKNRGNEKGYASYMGIIGEEEKVRALAEDIKKTATYIKGENSSEREFI